MENDAFKDIRVGVYGLWANEQGGQNWLHSDNGVQKHVKLQLYGFYYFF